jgi:hypothetical protein
MLTPQNYFEKVKGLDFEKMPAAIKEGHKFIVDMTGSADNWDEYHDSVIIKEMVDIYFTALQKQLPAEKSEIQPKGKQLTKEKKAGTKKTAAKQSSAPTIDEATAKEMAKKFIYPYVLRGETVAQLNKSYMSSHNGDFSASIRSNKIAIDSIKGEKVKFTFSLLKIYQEILEEEGRTAPEPKTAKPKPTKKKGDVPQQQPTKPAVNAKPVERVDEEIKFIKRYIQLHGKDKTKVQVLNFINSLQRAILEKRIRKTSPYAEQIRYIQDGLIKLYNKMGNSIEIKLRDNILSQMTEIAGLEKVRLSVSYLKRYIGMQGKEITKEKAEKLLNLIAGALDKEKIPGSDPYMEKMKKVLSSLRAYIRSTDQPDALHVHEATLAGLQKALDGCGCGSHKLKEGLQGVGEYSADTNPPSNAIMNSMDFANVKFDTLGFKGKWRELIGDPSSNFTAMIFGKPKMGKSYLSVDFAGYLARNHGKVLYVAKEEGLDRTLQEKLNDKHVKHPDLYVTGALPENLDAYSFIFLDSVSRLGLTPEDLRQLKGQYPGKSFIYIFQSTKAGNFRGENSFQHDVDVVIEVPEKGKAVQMGRFNQGGEMEIF